VVTDPLLEENAQSSMKEERNPSFHYSQSILCRAVLRLGEAAIIRSTTNLSWW